MRRGISRGGACFIIMSKQILITGGAGFVGSHLADELLARGYRVRVLDSLAHQVHGPAALRPAYLDPDVELMTGDIRDPEAVRRVLEGVDAVYHLAASVGVAQSMYEIARYTQVNNLGTAVLLEALIARPVERLIVASSMSIYGEGLYRAPDGTLTEGVGRTVEQLRRKRWEVCSAQGEPLAPLPTPETKSPSFASVYALSKYDQERMCLVVGRAYNIPVVALRFFNIYGARQALSNPYTGVLAIFSSRLLNDKPPLVFEDGGQQRDFVNVRDVVQGCLLALTEPQAAGRVLNIGSGTRHTILEIAQRMAHVLGKGDIAPEVVERYRVGDIRHCFADITQAKQVLGYAPVVTLEEGLRELAEWVAGEVAVDHVAAASAELARRGLAV